MFTHINLRPFLGQNDERVGAFDSNVLGRCAGDWKEQSGDNPQGQEMLSHNVFYQIELKNGWLTAYKTL
jgi:hypothetical protein